MVSYGEHELQHRSGRMDFFDQIRRGMLRGRRPHGEWVGGWVGVSGDPGGGAEAGPGFRREAPCFFFPGKCPQTALRDRFGGSPPLKGVPVPPGS